MNTGILKLSALLGLDLVLLTLVFQDAVIAGGITACIAVYALFGGRLSLWQEGAIQTSALPEYEASRLEAARNLLQADHKAVLGMDISKLKLYLVPGDDRMNATAYGMGHVSVTRGTLQHSDLVTLAAVLAHEVSHIKHFDSECNRTVFASVTILAGTVSLLSAGMIGLLFLFFLCMSAFRSWLGVMVFQGSCKAVRGLFRLLQRFIIAAYRLVMSAVSRAAEYRADREAGMLGYSLQLAHFLSLTDLEGTPTSLRDVLYRSHPPSSQRIARLLQQSESDISIR